MGSPRIQRCNRDNGRGLAWKKDLPIARERAELGTAARSIIEAASRRVEKQVHRPDSERFVRALKEQVELWPLDVPVEHHPQRSVFRLPAARHDMEGAVLEPNAGARQAQPRRIELKVGEMNDPVIAALEVRC